MEDIRLLKKVKTEINNLDSDAYLKDDEVFIIDSCYSLESLNQLLDTMIERLNTSDKALIDDKTAGALSELAILMDETLKLKANQTCENTDYRTGFLSALSIVEGFIAVRKGILQDRFKVFYQLLFANDSVGDVYDVLDDAIDATKKDVKIVGILRNTIITETDTLVERVWTRE